MTGEIPEPNNFLAEHRQEVTDWAAAILEHFDHATSGKENDGRLHLPAQQAHSLNASWEAPGGTLEELPEDIKATIAYLPDHQLRFDLSLAEGSAVRSQSLVIIDTIDPEAPVHEFNHYVNAHDQQPIKPLDPWHPNYWNPQNMPPDKIRAIMGAIFSQNPNYQNALLDGDLLAACQAAVLAQESPTYITTRDSTNKVYDIRLRSGQPILAGFNLSVKIDDRYHPNGKPSRTTLTLNRYIDPLSYGLESDATVTLNQLLSFDQSPSGEIVKIDSDGGVVLKIQGSEHNLPISSQIGQDRDSALSQPTMEDLALFKRLITEPISPADLAVEADII